MITILRGLKEKRRFVLLLTFMLAFTLVVSGLQAPQIANAGINTTSSIDIYLDGSATPVGTITSSDINSATDYGNYQYSGRRNNGSTGYYTTYGASLTDLLNDVLSVSIYDTSDLIRVDFTSLVGPNYTRSFCNPQAQLFTDRNAYSDLDAVSPTITNVPAILSTTSATVGSSVTDDDAIRLFFGTTSTTEKNIPYFTSNISRIDLYTSGSCPVDHYAY
ncbi:hypothetical protein D3C76_1030960 [compost metagenome]